MKVCVKCGDEKELEYFHKVSTRSDGKDAYCKECRKEINREYKSRNKDVIRKYTREYKRKVNNSKPERYIYGNDENPSYIYDLDNYKEEEGYLYLIKEVQYTGRIKIGKAKNVNQRFSLIQANFPWSNSIELIHKEKSKNMNRREKELHMIFNHKRVHNEWFELEKEDIKFIKKFMKKDQDVSVEEILEGLIFDQKTV